METTNWQSSIPKIHPNKHKTIEKFGANLSETPPSLLQCCLPKKPSILEPPSSSSLHHIESKWFAVSQYLHERGKKKTGRVQDERLARQLGFNSGRVLRENVRRVLERKSAQRKVGSGRKKSVKYSLIHKFMRKEAKKMNWDFTLAHMGNLVKNEFGIGLHQLVTKIMKEYNWDKVNLSVLDEFS